MKFSAIIVSALAAFVTAAPTSTPEATTTELQTRAFAFDLNAFNNFQFVNQDLAYLNVLNQFAFNNIHGLAVNNGLNLNAFQGLFAQQQFDLNSLLLLSQLHTFNQIASLGVLNNFNLQAFQFQNFQLGLLQPGFNQIQLGQFITPTVGTQIGGIAKQQRGFIL
ncbi:hypothetical protein MCOR27_001216 [Pyricularia oryzae]|uniref:Uncharacterized protein n=3 Tax=Pyricularia TaxID=48558 RepID=A0ABQ8NIA6_PYRGI|nr:uncharacterized protein MGG_01532 [Pyricularia oryzae 70-15]KAH8838928.1 hypothetical protein MCOR01_008173 [Pyricularia oryzae]KAI6297561.1 hypothetical protein MCOR33_006146 [Pyricularia grisea]EHA54698.1 hypothetical protein MGG_01532 [Pyricularia oryzae 70-15]KAH9438761.1 hypothetical protein MCOR02_002364 [Pyricularia oryzae]KAI6256266.1 hypothetical protein MCOR19_007267 [Pyricularia oryzae]